MCTLTCRPGGEQITVPLGTLLFHACKKAGVVVPNLCGNRALCSTCAALVVEGSENLDPPSRQERRLLKWIGAPLSVRLTCQARIHGDVVIIPAISPIERLDYDPSDLPWTVHEPPPEEDASGGPTDADPTAEL